MEHIMNMVVMQRPTGAAVAPVAPGTEPATAPAVAPPASDVPPVPMTLPRQAAHYLQRYGATYGCAVLTARERALLPDDGIDRWMVDGRCLTTDEMVALATRRGFPIAAWR